MDLEQLDTRLAVYGTLAPGRRNEHELAHLGGTWITGTVRGHLREQGWGSAHGYPGIVLDADGPEVEVHVLTSARLVDEWARLDEFEGPGYRRATVKVEAETGPLAAWIYELAAS